MSAKILRWALGRGARGDDSGEVKGKLRVLIPDP
jgi:hypothetical protein